MKLFDSLKGRSDINVAFIGGSLTEGAGASKRANRYSSLVTQYIAQQLPTANVSEINAAIGGTTSMFGLFRLQKQVLDKAPDVLFIEYAVNDCGNESLLSYYEGLIRTSRRYYPNLPIVTLIAYCDGNYNAEGENAHGYKVTVKGQANIAKAYGVPVIYMGKPLYDKICECGDMKKYITDTVHPNDLGYSVYFDEIKRVLPDAEFTFEFPQQPVTGKDFISPVMIPAEELTNAKGDFLLSKRVTTYGGNLRYFCADTKGQTLEIDFEGTVCAAYTRIEKDSGIANVYIDDNFVCEFNQWDTYANSFDRDSCAFFADNLEYGKHTLKFEVTGKKSPESEGHVIRVAALLTANVVEYK